MLKFFLGFNIYYVIIGLVTFVALLFIILFIVVFRKVRSGSGEKINLIEFPLETNSKINNFINQVSNFLNELGKIVNKDHKKTLNEINEKIHVFEKFANEKNQELLTYKEGYEFSKYKNIIMGIIDTIDLLESLITSTSDQHTKENFLAIKDKLEIVLNNNGIEKFIPNINQKIFDTVGCEPSRSTEKTTDESKVNLIHSIIKPGYKITLKKDLNKIIKKSEVKVYSLANE